MKRIILEIDDEAFRALRSAMGVRGLAQTAGGVIDSFMIRLIEKLEAGEEVFVAKLKRSPF